MVQEAEPVASVVPEQDCAEPPEPSVKVSVRPEIGAVPSSFSTPERVSGAPFAALAGPVYVVVVSSCVTVNVAVAVEPRSVALPAKEAVSGYGPAASCGVIGHEATPLPLVTAEQVSAPFSVNVTVCPATGPSSSVKVAATLAGSL